MKNPDTVRAAGVDRKKSKSLNLRRGHNKIKQDARVLQLLRKECQTTGTGAVAIQAVFRGLLSVHDEQINEFVKAIRESADGE